MIPSFLAQGFDVEALEGDASTLVALDPAGMILWVNPAWERFALANGGADVPARFGPGTSYFAGIAPPLRGFYESALEMALATGELFDREYECSSADKYRLFHMRALPIDGTGLLLEHSLMVERPHDGEASHPGGQEYVRSNGTVLQCSNCRRTFHPATTTWHWIPSWVREPPPMTSHGLCRICFHSYYG